MADIELNTAILSDLNAVSSAFSRVHRHYTIPARAEIATTAIPAIVEAIQTLGYYEPGDGGDGIYFRRAGAPDSWHITNPGFGQSLDGQWWELGSQGGEPIYLEQFGAKGDRYLINPETWTGSTNPTPTNNHDAIIYAATFFTAADPHNVRPGPTIRVGKGEFYTDTIDLSDINSAITFEGLNREVSRFIFPAGSAGIIRSAAGNVPITVRNLGLRCLGHGGQTTKHGINFQSPHTVEHCSIVGFGGHGIEVQANALSTPSSNANVFYINHCTIDENALDGIHIQGNDANAGVTHDCNFNSNGRWGLNDESFLKNFHSGHHAASNGNRILKYGGPYRLLGLNGSSVLIGSYSESDQSESDIGEDQIVIGGLHAAGLNLRQNALSILGNVVVGGIRLSPNSLEQVDNDAYIILGNEKNVMYQFGGANDPFGYKFRHVSFNGHVIDYNSGPYSWGITPTEGSNNRTPLTVNNIMMAPRGFFYGAPGAAFTAQRKFISVAAQPAESNTEYLSGDIGIGTDGLAAGWLCHTTGVNDLDNWVSGTIYTLYKVVRNGVGRVYQLTKIPRDPDAWTKPACTNFPTHSSGTVSYTEPNPQIDPGESATIPGYTWQVIAYAPTLSFSFQASVTEGIYEAGHWVTNEDNSTTYLCTAEPVAPTPIFNTAWSMPGSTNEPVHTSGAVAYTEPNPSPSGSEPATIPGYEWMYINDNPAPTWRRFGQGFTEVFEVRDVPSVASGAVSSIFTISVPGARFGDYPKIGVGLNLQGMIANVWISNTDQVSYQFHNYTGGAIDLASTNVLVCVDHSALF